MWTIFFVQLVGLISPGPDFFYVSRKAASSNRRNAVYGSIGITLGVGFWALVVLFGLAFLNQTVPAFKEILMVLGGSYLFYTGLKMVRITENARLKTAETAIETTSIGAEILKGLMINLSNPKIVVFFSSVLSAYVGNLSQFSDILLVLFILMGSALVYFSLVSVLFSHKKIQQFYAQHNRYLDNLAGVVFILFGVKLIYDGVYLLFF